MRKIIKRLRRKYSLSQTGLAAALKVSQPIISQIEGGVKPCSISMALKIKRLIKIDDQDQKNIDDYIQGRL